MNTVSPDDMFSGGMVTMHLYTIAWDGGSTRFPSLMTLTDEQAIEQAPNHGGFLGANPRVTVESTTRYRAPIEPETKTCSVMEFTED